MKPQINSSRLSRRIEKQTNRQIIMSIFGIALVILLVLKFGPLFIDRFASFIGQFKSENNNTAIQSKSRLEPPILNSTFSATDSATIIVSGKSAYEEGEIEIYVNNVLSRRETLDGNEFEAELEVFPGENIIKARYKDNKNESDFSSEFIVSYVKDAPILEISFPQDGETFSKADQEINIVGKTEVENTITVNGFRAIVNTDGSFLYYFRLGEGENTISVEASNPAGKKIKKEIKVTYNP